VTCSPPRDASAGSEAVELAASAGLILDDWQALALEEACGERDGKWAAFEVGVVAPRQNGKGSILEARVLAGLFLFGERLIIWSAHEFKTAKEAYLRVRNLVENAPHLHALVSKYYQSNETTEIVLRSGARLKFLARNSTSGRGFTGDLVILDEAFALLPDTMAAILPTMAAKSITGNPQLWYTSSAGMRSSVQLRAVRKRAQSDDPGSLCWLEWSAPPEARQTPDDRQWWRMANPALGIRISEDFLASAFATMAGAGDDGVDQFCREHLGTFDEDEVPDAVFQPAQWDAVASDDVFNAPVTFALEVNPERTWASIAAADADELCELGEHRPGVGWVVDRLSALCAKTGASVAIHKASPAASLRAELEAVKIKVIELDAAEFRDACGQFFDAVVDPDVRRVRVRRHPALDAAVKAAMKRTSGDAWIWDRRTGEVSPLVAVTVARWAAVNTPKPQPFFIY
jgi:hypothetical protein